MQNKLQQPSLLWQKMTGIGGIVIAGVFGLLMTLPEVENIPFRIGITLAMLLTLPMLYNKTLRHFLLIPAVFVLSTCFWVWISHGNILF